LAAGDQILQRGLESGNIELARIGASRPDQRAALEALELLLAFTGIKAAADRLRLLNWCASFRATRRKTPSR
jgi:hypothetical protein